MQKNDKKYKAGSVFIFADTFERQFTSSKQFLQDKDMSAKFFALFTTNITVNYFFAKNFISKTYKKHIV